MDVLIFLIPGALVLGGLGLVAFLWSLKSGQYDDLDGAGWRILSDDDLPPEARPEKTEVKDGAPR
jgi:cbb3-type cytochrome oxidase maturation protein